MLSELYFYLWFPTKKHFWNCLLPLWIAFRIVFLLMIPNDKSLDDLAMPVVNCFQNCIFTYDSQLSAEEKPKGKCCELLSELYFYLWFPTKSQEVAIGTLLWIAFRIVFLLMIPNDHHQKQLNSHVVNCFQNCIFTYDSQRFTAHFVVPICCELLSELYFYLWFPT